MPRDLLHILLRYSDTSLPIKRVFIPHFTTYFTEIFLSRTTHLKMENKSLSFKLYPQSLNSSSNMLDLNKAPEPEIDPNEIPVIDLISCPSPPPIQVEPLVAICPMTGLPMMIKTLRHSDVRCSGRLSLKRFWVDSCFLPTLVKDVAIKIHGADGALLNMKDLDTDTNHSIRVKHWGSVNTIVLITHWYPSFVKRRELRKGDRITLAWDDSHCILLFRVFKRAN